MVKNLKVLYMYALCVPFNPFDLRPCTDGEGGGAMRGYIFWYGAGICKHFFNCYKFFIPYRIFWYQPTFGENCFVFKPQLPPKRLLLDRVCSCTLLHNQQHLQNCLELTKNTEKRLWMVLFMVKGDAMVWVRMPQFLFALKDEKMRK